MRRSEARREAARQLYDAYKDGHEAGMNTPINHDKPWRYWDADVISPTDFDVWIESERARGFAKGRDRRRAELACACSELTTKDTP